MTIDLSAERWRAILRAVLLLVLLASWSGYALREPRSSGVELLKAALKKNRSSESSSASVSWLGGGVPLAPAKLVLRAKEISAKVDARPRDLGLVPEDRRSGDGDPAIVVPMLIGKLQSPLREDRTYAAMTMCDNRFAGWERAGEAVPGLEEVADEKGEGGEFAELALKRIRFWANKRGSPATPR